MPRHGTVILAAGGTGGHLFPARALAETLIDRGHRVLLFTDRRGQGFRVEGDRFAIRRLFARAMTGGGWRAKIIGALFLGVGTLQALSALLWQRPQLVVGFGGYPSIPAVVAAQLLRIPTVLHEQNAVIGRANRLVARRANRIATSFPLVKGIGPVLQRRAVHTGNPVRPDIVAMRNRPWPSLDPTSPLNLLITGGSQGARAFSDVVPAALAGMPRDFQARVTVVQQARPEDVDRVIAAYAGTAVRAEVQAFFSDMAERLQKAHLLICRSGASTVAELSVVGRPAILVPYPNAIDDHQTVNARALVQAGGAWLIPQPDFTPATLRARFEALLADPSDLEIARARAQAKGRPDAAAALATLVERVGGIGNFSRKPDGHQQPGNRQEANTPEGRPTIDPPPEDGDAHASDRNPEKAVMEGLA